jgi:hypothetical protein
MSLPGFNADASLAPARSHYAGAAVNGAGCEVVPSVAPIPCLFGCVNLALELRGPFAPPPTPAELAAITAACGEICGVANAAAVLAEVLAGGFASSGGAAATGGAATAGGAAAGGITIGTLPGLLIAGAIGIPLGAGIGLGAEYLFTPPAPVTTMPQSCRMAGTTLTTGTTTGCFFGCRRSLNKTLIQAENICASLGPSYCTGACPTGAPCMPTAITIPRPNQSLCRYGCETVVDYTCTCGC